MLLLHNAGRPPPQSNGQYGGLSRRGPHLIPRWVGNFLHSGTGCCVVVIIIDMQIAPVVLPKDYAGRTWSQLGSNVQKYPIESS